MKAAVVALTVGLVPAMAIAQETSTEPSLSSGSTMGQLIAQGYEIKAAVPNGKSFVVFLQKDTTGYACQMTTLSRAVCGKIN